MTSQLKVSTIDGIIARVKEEEDRNGPVLEDISVVDTSTKPKENGVDSRHSSKKSKKKVRTGLCQVSSLGRQWHMITSSLDP